MILRLAVFVVGCAILGGESAARQPPPAGNHPGNIDLINSRVYVFVGKKGLGHDHAVVGMLREGHVQFDAAEQAGQLVFDMGSFRADTADARKVLGLPGETDAKTQQQVNDNMLGPDVLDVARHPTATLTIRSALRSQRPAPGPLPLYELSGTFTLHGVARAVVVFAEVETVGGIVRLKGRFPIKQTDFGMKPYAKFGGVVGVADELKIYGDIRLVAAQGPAR
jgi:polyisoprenoid-binding protein YceI